MVKESLSRGLDKEGLERLLSCIGVLFEVENDEAARETYEIEEEQGLIAKLVHKCTGEHRLQMIALLEQMILKSGEKKSRITTPALIGAYLNNIQGAESQNIARQVRDLIEGIKDN